MKNDKSPGQIQGFALFEQPVLDPLSEDESVAINPAARKFTKVYSINTLKGFLATTTFTTSPEVERAQRAISPTAPSRSSAVKAVVRVANEQAQR